MPQEDMLVEEPKVHCLGKMVDIDKVKPNPENPNVHPEEQVKILSEILKVNGWRQAIIVSVRSGMVVKGHGRLQTAKHLKLTKVPVEYQNYADEQAEYADMIADNRAAQHSYVDAFKLGALLKKISAKGKETLGYSQEEMDLYMASEYVAPKETDRQFVVLETLKMTKESKAIISRAVQRFCLAAGKEMDWGEVLATICVQWEGGQPPVPEPKPAPAPEKKAEKPKKEKAPKAEKAPEKAPAKSEESSEERVFKVKYVAGTTLGELDVMVIRPEDSTDRFYTVDPEAVKSAKAAKEKSADLVAVLRKKDGVLWIESLEVA